VKEKGVRLEPCVSSNEVVPKTFEKPKEKKKNSSSGTNSLPSPLQGDTHYHKS